MAAATLSSISKIIPPIMHGSGIIVVSVDPSPESLNRLDKASGLVFFEPGLNDNEKLNLEKKRAHLACLGLNRLADRMYVVFMIGPDQKRLFSSFQPMPPLLQSHLDR